LRRLLNLKSSGWGLAAEGWPLGRTPALILAPARLCITTVNPQ
jgi:hypothetical protein